MLPSARWLGLDWSNDLARRRMPEKCRGARARAISARQEDRDEVADRHRPGLHRVPAAQDREREFAVALDAANNSAILSRSQYRTGLTDFTTLNQQEVALLSARNGATQARADAATALVALYAALGGGWDATVIPQAPISNPEAR